MKPLSHLDWLEAESVYILREAAAECRNPVLLYSIGKDSSVLLHLAAKAFYPGRIPFPVLHIDTTWKFRDMIAFRDRRAAELGLRLIVHTNRDGLAQGIDPFPSGSYIEREEIPIVPLYFAADRPVVRRDGTLLMRDDDRLELQPGETVETRKVRFRTLGCYPLTGAIESNAASVAQIVAETAGLRRSERDGRLIDHDASASMEQKKREGYF